MADLATNYVLGYHGCEREVGEALLAGVSFKPSDNKYDWLGPGIYFWEADPLRGFEWAETQVKKGKFKEAFVVGAAIDLGHCLDLFSRSAIVAVKRSYESLIELHDADTTLGPLPVNELGEDKLLRHLDCAVINNFHQIVADRGLQRYDSVRGLFREGKPIYTDAGFYAKSHIQIAICNPANILGVFRVPEDHLS